MAKLTKTQTKMLREAADHVYGRTVAETGFITTHRIRYDGRETGYGSRRRDAGKALVDAGLMRLVSSYAHVSPTLCRFGSHHSTEFVFEITDAGRAALNA